MTSRQLSEWVAWAQVRGMPEARADVRSGQICAVLGNIHRDRDATAFRPADFIAQEPCEREEDEPAELTPEQRSRELMHMLGKKD